MLSAGFAQADGLRPAIATPLQAAERDVAAHEFAAALRQVNKAAAVPDQSAQESLTIAQVRASVDMGRLDYPAAAADYQALINSGSLGADQVRLMAQAEVSADYAAGNYAGTIHTINAYLAGDPQYTPVLLQAYLKSNDCTALSGAVNHLGKTPPEADLQMVAYCDGSTKDTAGYVQAMTALVADYPNPQYWAQLLGQEAVDPAFSNQLSLDFYRLKTAVGLPASASDYMDMTQTALQEGLPNEAARIIAQGFATGALGTGADADRQARLKALVLQRQAAAVSGAAAQIATAKGANDELTLFGIGFNEADGGNAAGLDLMANAIRSGQLTQPGQAELELGIAYHELGQQANALAMWNAVQGGGAPVTLARLWTYVK